MTALVPLWWAIAWLYLPRDVAVWVRDWWVAR